MKNNFLVMAATFLLAGCNYVELKDGKVPADYLTQAQKFAGTYGGKMEGRPGRLVVSIQNRSVRVAFQGDRSNDIIGDKCHSSIGALKGVYISSDKKRVKSAVFGFNPGNCTSVEGRTLEITIESEKILWARIVESSTFIPGDDWCSPGGPPDYSDGFCHHSPDTVSYTYFDGEFRR